MKLLIYEIRIAKGLTLEELEKLTKISKSTLHRYEKAENENANIKKLEIIAKALNCKIQDLYESEYK